MISYLKCFSVNVKHPAVKAINIFRMHSGRDSSSSGLQKKDALFQILELQKEDWLEHIVNLFSLVDVFHILQWQHTSH